MENEKVFAMPFAKVYPLLVAKAERKGRTQAEVDDLVCWLTGYTPEGLADHLERSSSYRDFFAEAPAYNPRSELIIGKVCGIQVDAIEDPLMKKIRQLDKLIDELAKGKKIEKIKR